MTISDWIKISTLSIKDKSTLIFSVLAPKTLLDAPAWVLSHTEDKLDDNQLGRLNKCTQRRLAGEPVQYITNQAEFMDLKLYVDHRVLIPRQETEELVNLVINYLDSLTPALSQRAREKEGDFILNPSPEGEGGWKPGEGQTNITLADIGTGSGAIAIALATWANKNKFNIQIIASDVSKDALSVAKSNFKSVKLDLFDQSDLLKFKLGDLLSPISDPVDIIVSNLPYIPSCWLKKIDKSVADYEPEVALDGGKTGLELIRKLLKQAPTKLKPDGRIFLEIWHEFTNKDFEQFANFDTKLIKDSFNHTRFAVLKQKSK